MRKHVIFILDQGCTNFLKFNEPLQNSRPQVCVISKFIVEDPLMSGATIKIWSSGYPSAWDLCTPVLDDTAPMSEDSTLHEIS